MKTLSIVVAVVALASVGGVGGYDYASNGKVGLLPSAWTNCFESESCCPTGDCCPECCPDSSCCPLTASAEGVTCPLTGEELPGPDCCPLNQAK
jgi:hypothetical protein